MLQLGRNEKTRTALGDVLHHPDRRRVRAMDGAERVVDVDLRQRRQLARKLVVVRFLLGVKAQVLQQQHLPFTQLSDQLAHAVADAVVGEDHVAAEQPREHRARRFQRHLRHHSSIRPP